jgi:hypothetical protein
VLLSNLSGAILYIIKGKEHWGQEQAINKLPPDKFERSTIERILSFNQESLKQTLLKGEI